MSNFIQKGYGLRVASLEATTDKATFSGVASVFNVPDLHGDVIRSTAFQKSLSESGPRLPLMWVHDPRETLGSIEVQSDARQLNVKGSLLLEIARAREVHSLMREGAVKGLSIGFWPLRMRELDDGSGLEFQEARLLEVSICPTPAHPQARITEVKALGDLIKSLDARSDRHALALIRKAIDDMLHDADPDDDPRELLDALGSVDRWAR